MTGDRQPRKKGERGRKKNKEKKEDREEEERRTGILERMGHVAWWPIETLVFCINNQRGVEQPACYTVG
jgi:hypothetical protein